MEAVLRAEPGIVPVGSAAGPYDALALVRRARPDVVLVDARLAEHDGLELCRTLQAEPAPPAMLVLSGAADRALDAAARAAGARGAIDKSTDLPELFDAIRLAARPVDEVA